MEDKNHSLRDLGLIINRLRKEKKLTQEQLGQLTGTSSMTVKRLESATSSTGVDKLLAISKVLGVSLTELFNEVEGQSNSLPAKIDPRIGELALKMNSLPDEQKVWLTDIVDRVLRKPETKKRANGI